MVEKENQISKIKMQNDKSKLKIVMPKAFDNFDI